MGFQKFFFFLMPSIKTNAWIAKLEMASCFIFIFWQLHSSSENGTQRKIIFVTFFLDSFTGCDGTGTYSENVRCCSSSQPCGVSEGHCDNDDQCLGHLLCGTKNCFPPFSLYADCCYDPFPGKQRLHSNYPNRFMGSS